MPLHHVRVSLQRSRGQRGVHGGGGGGVGCSVRGVVGSGASTRGG